MGFTRFFTASLIIAAIGSAFAFQTDPRAQATRGLSDVKQLALGTMMYCQDYDDVYPYVRSTKPLAKAIAPYLKNQQVWQTLNPAGSVFAFNLSIGGASGSVIELPAATVMYYETKPWADGLRIVAFCDGHAKRVKASDWHKLEPTLHLHVKRVAKKPIG
jgi:prepilin-type processing-associated H-X9-DG protein